MNNEYIVIKRVKKAYDECSSVFTQKVNSIKEESWRIEKWVWGYKKWMKDKKTNHNIKKECRIDKVSWPFLV